MRRRLFPPPFLSLSLSLPLLLALLGAPAAVAGTRCEQRSPAHTVALVELYTSEGCSSCPPADRWLAALDEQQAAGRLVALALHVDYWDYIGWQDPWAQPGFAARQRQLAGGGTIYTPEVFVGQRELRRWHEADAFARRVQEINRQPARADIVLAMENNAAAAAATGPARIVAEAHFTLPAKPSAEALTGVLVVYEDGLVSAVQRGENRGATLRHARVVRRWLPQALADERATLRREFTVEAGWNPEKLGLAAFVQDARSGEILQALALPACKPRNDSPRAAAPH